MFLWQFEVAGNNKTCLGLHVKCIIFLYNFTQFGIARNMLIKVSDIKFKNPI
jgi:hypothetical protein